MNNHRESIIFAGGCFWCTEAVFKSLKGISAVTPGYIGGQISDPTYEKVISGNTGHAEAVKIEYDPSIISFNDLLTVFFNVHDPTTLNRQGNDVGSQYRSAIFYSDETQKTEAEKFIRELTDARAYDKPIVTEVKSAEPFYPAEEYHRDYYARNANMPYCELVIAPKMQKLQERFAQLLDHDQTKV